MRSYIIGNIRSIFMGNSGAFRSNITDYIRTHRTRSSKWFQSFSEKAERERVERVEARLIVAFSVSVCTCGVGAAIAGAAVLLKGAR